MNPITAKQNLFDLIRTHRKISSQNNLADIVEMGKGTLTKQIKDASSYSIKGCYETAIVTTLNLPRDIFQVYQHMSNYEILDYFTKYDIKIKDLQEITPSQEMKSLLVGKWYSYGYSSDPSSSGSNIYEYKINIDKNMNFKFEIDGFTGTEGKILIDRNRYIYFIFYLNDPSHFETQIFSVNFDKSPQNNIFISAYRTNKYGDYGDHGIMVGYSLTSKVRLNNDE